VAASATLRRCASASRRAAEKDPATLSAAAGIGLVPHENLCFLPIGSRDALAIMDPCWTLASILNVEPMECQTSVGLSVVMHAQSGLLRSVKQHHRPRRVSSGIKQLWRSLLSVFVGQELLPLNNSSHLRGDKTPPRCHPKSRPSGGIPDVSPCEETYV
jgi:hypothetical protein